MRWTSHFHNNVHSLHVKTDDKLSDLAVFLYITSVSKQNEYAADRRACIYQWCTVAYSRHTQSHWEGGRKQQQQKKRLRYHKAFRPINRTIFMRSLFIRCSLIIPLIGCNEDENKRWGETSRRRRIFFCLLFVKSLFGSKLELHKLCVDEFCNGTFALPEIHVNWRKPQKKKNDEETIPN